MNKTTLTRRFAHCLKLGTGEAYLIARDNPGLNISKEVLRAACHNDAYDPQVEGDRGSYVYSIIELLPTRDQIIAAVLKRLINEKDEYDADHMFEIARLAVNDGNEKARTAIYERYAKNAVKGYDYAGERSIIGMDGVDGALRAANMWGVRLQKGEKYYGVFSKIDLFNELHPEVRVFARLKAAAKDNKNVALFLAAVKEYDQERKNRKDFTFSYESIKDRINNNQRYSGGLALKYLPKDDVDRLAVDLLQEKRRKRQEMYLWLFSEFRFPLGHKPLIELCSRPDSPRDRLKYLSVKALSYFEHKDVRTFFLDHVNDKDAYKYLPLLELNYRRGDHKIIKQIIDRAHDKHIIHSTVFSLVDIYRENPTRACKEPILAMYDKLNCCLHREDILRILHHNRVLPASMLHEATYDCYDETAEWARGLLNT